MDPRPAIIIHGSQLVMMLGDLQECVQADTASPLLSTPESSENEEDGQVHAGLERPPENSMHC